MSPTIMKVFSLQVPQCLSSFKSSKDIFYLYQNLELDFVRLLIV